LKTNYLMPMATTKEEEESEERKPTSVHSVLSDAGEKYYHLIDPNVPVIGQNLEECEIVAVIAHDISFEN